MSLIAAQYLLDGWIGGRIRSQLWLQMPCSIHFTLLADKEEERNVIQDIISLPEKYRIAIYLHYVEGYQCKEIAEILGKSESAVKMRLKRGKEMLKSERR